MEPTGPIVRLCILKKWSDHDGYGFNLHAEKNKNGVHRIGQVEPNSPAQAAGLCEGDLIVEVQGVNVSTENHRQVVERIKAVPNETRLLVVDEEADKWYKSRGLIVNGSQPNIEIKTTPDSRPDSSNGSSLSGRQSSADNNSEPEAIENGVLHLKIESVANQVESNNNNGPENQQKNPIVSSTPVAVDTMTKATENLNGGGTSSGGSSPRSSTPNEPQSPTPANGPAATEPEQSSAPNTPVIKEPIVVVPALKQQQAVNSRGSSVAESNGSNSSVPASPTSTKSATSSNGNSSLPPSTDLNLNMSVAEMRAFLAQKKKHDAKKAGIDLRQKYEIIQQM